MLSISCRDIEEFTEFSHDINPLHIDEDYGRKTPFGHCVVYGILGILKMLDKILADNQEQGIFIESIQYKFNRPISENKKYKLVKVESSEGDWQLCDSNQTLVELKFQYSSCAFHKTEIEKNSISYLKIAANPNDVDLANIDYKEDYALNSEAWESFLQRHSNLARIPLEQLTSLVWTSYCIGMRAPGRQALYMGGKINFSKSILNGNNTCSQIECSVVTNNWDSSTGSLILDAEVKANNQVIAKINLDSLKRPDSVVISMETLASNWDKIPTNHWLRDKVCLVTGGSRGLGSAIAKTLALFGAIVAINYRSSDEEASKVLQEIEINGGKAALFKGDVAAPGICKQIVDEIIKKYGGLNLVINNAHPF
ncbi:MAG: SDR family NAD(P)-dependent oxidoreductase, partial [Microcoleaceae cyanobacterium]